MRRLEYGNKIAILGGDYLLANACTGLADLRLVGFVTIASIVVALTFFSCFTGTPSLLRCSAWPLRTSHSRNFLERGTSREGELETKIHHIQNPQSLVTGSSLPTPPPPSPGGCSTTPSRTGTSWPTAARPP